jgi:ribokinase
VIAVLGSANMDVVTEVARIPGPGETVLGKSVRRYPGGKGANQAVAAARLGESVAFFGKVGVDAFGDELLASLENDGIDVAAVERDLALPTGQATILVDEAGENAIACTPGANGSVDADYVDRVFDRLCAADVILLQFEIPVASIAHLLARLPSDRPLVIVDPAPARDVSILPLERIDILTPNQSELLALTHLDDVPSAGRSLLARGVRGVICKAGEEGAYWITEKTIHISAPAVEAIDTTAAGDAFNGALACVIMRRPIEQAIRWAVAAGSQSTLKLGAQPSLPSRERVETLHDEQWPAL